MSRSVLRGTALAGGPVAVPARTPPPAIDAGDPAALIEGARAEAAGIVAAARADADAQREEARADGHRAGRAEGLASVAAALATVQGIADALGERRAAMEREAVDQATILAVEVAAKLVRAELAIAPERVVDVVRGAIRRASERRALTVLVHPDDLAVCRQAAGEIIERMGGIGALDFVDEPRVDRGSCVVRTPNGDVDARFSVQLERVLEALAAPPDPALTDPGGAA